jgi:hypothetical protein
MGIKMKEELLKYFESLKYKNLPVASDGIFCEDDWKIRTCKSSKYDVGYGLTTYIFGDQLMCVKSVLGRDFSKEEIIDIASSEYYKNAGVLSLISYPMYLTYNSDLFETSYPAHGVATHNLKGIKELEFCHGKQLIKQLRKDLLKSTSNWDLLKDEESKAFFLTIMTPECYDEFISMFLADKVAGFTDRHTDNYFFYRPYGSSRWHGVIVLDNGLVAPILTEKSFGLEGASSKNMIEHYNVQSWTPQVTQNMSTHGNNLKEIRDLIESGTLSNEQISTVKRIVEYPYAENLKKICNEYELSSSEVYDNVAMFWEYNREAMSL